MSGRLGSALVAALAAVAAAGCAPADPAAAPRAAGAAPAFRVLPTASAQEGAPKAGSVRAPATTRAPGAGASSTWRTRARPTTDVAPGVLARAAARRAQERAAPEPPGCRRAAEPPGKAPCPPTTGTIESIEIDWNAPPAR